VFCMTAPNMRRRVSPRVLEKRSERVELASFVFLLSAAVEVVGGLRSVFS
jgi:hypothetical protein